MTPEQAMAAVAVEVHGQHVSDHQYHASLGGNPCNRCKRLGEAAAVLQQQATRSVKLDWKIGDPPTQPFIWITVEGGVGDFGGETDRVEVVAIDYDFSEDPAEAIEAIDEAITRAERIPDRLNQLPHDDPRWLDRDGILTTLRQELAENLQREAGEEVFLTDDGIVPRCDICDKPQLVVGDDWDGDTGEHRSCQNPADRAAADRRIINDLKEVRA